MLIVSGFDWILWANSLIQKELREKHELLDIKIDSKSVQQVVVQEAHHNVQPQPIQQPQVDLSKVYELEALVRRLREELSRQGDRFSELENMFKMVIIISAWELISEPPINDRI